jgi:hypothetical protein
MLEQISSDPAQVLSKYLAAPSQLEAVLSSVAPGKLKLEAHPDGWTIAELAHHITDGDALWKACIFAGLGEATPVFSLEWYWSLPQDKWSQCWHYADRDISDSVAMFRANRSITATTLSRIPSWWERQVAILSRDRAVERHTILDVVESQANHAIQHIEEIKQALARSPTDDKRAA